VRILSQAAVTVVLLAALPAMAEEPGDPVQGLAYVRAHVTASKLKKTTSILMRRISR
jgi:hypothetical protein